MVFLSIVKYCHGEKEHQQQNRVGGETDAKIDDAAKIHRKREAPQCGKNGHNVKSADGIRDVS